LWLKRDIIGATEGSFFWEDPPKMGPIGKGFLGSDIRESVWTELCWAPPGRRPPGVSFGHGVVARGRPAQEPRGDRRRPELGASGPKNNGYNFALAVVLRLVRPHAEQGTARGQAPDPLVNSTAYSQTVDSPSTKRRWGITE
jgi:hypothetical protein